MSLARATHSWLFVELWDVNDKKGKPELKQSSPVINESLNPVWGWGGVGTRYLPIWFEVTENSEKIFENTRAKDFFFFNLILERRKNSHPEAIGLSQLSIHSDDALILLSVDPLGKEEPLPLQHRKSIFSWGGSSISPTACFFQINRRSPDEFFFRRN
jgi:hypothetical protein